MPLPWSLLRCWVVEARKLFDNCNRATLVCDDRALILREISDDVYRTLSNLMHQEIAIKADGLHFELLGERLSDVRLVSNIEVRPDGHLRIHENGSTLFVLDPRSFSP